jgi:hypothetical protein
MYVWMWALTGLCAAGALLALTSVLLLVRPALRIQGRLRNLRHARLFTSLESLEIQSARLEKLSREAAVLAERGQAAVTSIAQSANAPFHGEIAGSLRSSGEEISALLHELT